MGTVGTRPELRTDSVPLLFRQMESLKTDSLVGVSETEFEATIKGYLEVSDYTMEELPSADNQRRQMVDFCWGHDHDFGRFQLTGEMGTRHIWLLSRLMDHFGVLLPDLTGQRILDVGCWTGGTSLVLARMGAEVVAIDEVRKYVDSVNYLAHAFGLSNLTAHHLSLYDLDQDEYFEAFDHVLYLGVIYHVSDPVLALRHLYNCLKLGGTLSLETMAIDSTESICRYEGPQIKRGKSGWNWFVPALPALEKMVEDAGFVVRGIGDGLVRHVTGERDPLGPNRLFAVGAKAQRVQITRAGLSVRTIR